MKSFDPFYAILSVFIPVSVLAAFMPLVALVLGNFIGELPLSYWFFASLLSAICASVYWALVKKSKANHEPANIRGAILIMILAYCAGSLLHFDRSFLMKFFPSFHNIPTAVFAFVIWFPVVKIKATFDGQDLFESLINRFDGEKLRQIMLEDSSLLAEADADLKKLASRYGLFFIPSLILFIVAGGMGLRFTAPLMILLVFLFTAAICVIGFLNFLRREYAYAAEGLILSNRPKAIMAAIIVILSACGTGLFISSDKSLIPHTFLTDLLRRILAFFESLSREPVEAPPPLPPPQRPIQSQGGIPQELLEMLGEAEPSPFWDYVKYAALIFAAVLFLWFMINPLLGRTKLFRGINLLPKKVFIFLKKWFKMLAEGVSYFFGSLGGGNNGKKLQPSAKALKKIEDDILSGYSPAKQRELRRSIGLFARLIYWGQEKQNVKWKPSHAPIEYCVLLADTSGKPEVTRAGGLFEKALYSPNPLSRDEAKEFSRLVDEIVNMKNDG